MFINAQKVGDPRLHTVVQANIKNPRNIVDNIKSKLGKIFKK